MVATCSDASSSRLEQLLYGHDPLPGIVAVEPGGRGTAAGIGQAGRDPTQAGGSAVSLFRRSAGSVAAERDSFRPWLLMAEADLPGLPAGEWEVEQLRGGDYDRLVRFPRWALFAQAQAALRAAAVDFFALPSYVAQYLTLRGRTLFSGMSFEDVHRLQLDIEATTLRPEASGAAVLVIGLSDNRGYEEVLSARDLSERDLLLALNDRIARLDPDVLEGHNVTDYDLPYLAGRAERLGVELCWGRDESPLWLSERSGQGRFKVGGRVLPSNRVHVYGRHVIDTYQLVQRYDRDGRLESYGLKAVVEALGLLRPGRVFVEQTAVVDSWQRDPELVASYCLDDVRDVRALSAVVTPTEFYVTQIVPRSFQDVASGGTGEKINAILVRAYLAKRHGIPRPQPPRDYPGGYTEIRAAGVFQRVVKCDVESLYPAIMLHYGYRPASDTLDVFFPVLDELMRRRLEAKHRMREATRRAAGMPAGDALSQPANVGEGFERAYWDGLQSSYKILINSFYGYTAYFRANFNDYDAAKRVTTTGQQILRQLLALLEERGCTIIEADTDGVYFVPPPGVEGEAAEVALIEQIGANLPAGIRLAHDGRYAGMISLKQKTYILRMYDGRLIAKGSSLRSRRDELYLRRFAEEAATRLIQGSLEEVRDLYLCTAERIQRGELAVQEFTRRESITGKTFSNRNLRRLAAAATGMTPGQRIAVYQRQDGSLAPAHQYGGDEDRDYLLRRLHDMARRFAVLCSDEQQFKRLFPKLKAAQAPAPEQPVQLGLF